LNEPIQIPCVSSSLFSEVFNFHNTNFILGIIWKKTILVFSEISSFCLKRKTS